MIHLTFLQKPLSRVLFVGNGLNELCLDENHVEQGLIGNACECSGGDSEIYL